jgi:hypothetical protein
MLAHHVNGNAQHNQIDLKAKCINNESCEEKECNTKITAMTGPTNAQMKPVSVLSQQLQ